MNFIFTTVLVAIVSCTLADAYVLQVPRGSIVASLEQKCNSNAHNNHAFEDLTEAFEYLPQCTSKVMGNPEPTFYDGYNLFCNRIGDPDYYTCLDNFGKKLSPCLDEDEEYLPNFILTAYNVSLENTCGNENGLSRVNEMMKDIKSSTCGITQESLRTMHSSCFSNLLLIKNIKNSIFTFKKDYLCNDIRSWKGCMIQSLKDECNEDHTETFSFLIDSFLVTC